MNYFHNRMFYSSTYNFLRKLLTIGAVFIGYRFCGLVQLFACSFSCRFQGTLLSRYTKVYYMQKR